MFKQIALSLCFTLFLGLLTACSPDSLLRLNKNESSATNTPRNTVGNGEIGAPVAIPPRFDDGPLRPGQVSNQTMPNGLPALQPMKGVNVDALFSESIKDSGERFDRVENAVVDLRKEFEVYKPSIVRLAAVETDIQNLIMELEVLLQETPNQQAPLDISGRQQPSLQVKQLDPQPKPPPELKEQKKKTAYKKPPDKSKKQTLKSHSGTVALNLRIGEHNDKVRVAFDTNKKTPYSIDLDNKEKLIIIELPEARWEGQDTMSFPNSKLVDGLSVEPIGSSGSLIVLSLKKQARILQKKILSPDKISEYHRIYFDLRP